MKTRTTQSGIRYNASPSVEITDIHKNTSQEIVEITVDKLQLVLKDHQTCIEKKKEWHTPLAIVLAIITAFISTDFKAALGLSADTWAAIYVILLLLCLGWTGRAIWSSCNSPSLENLVDKIKKS